MEAVTDRQAAVDLIGHFEAISKHVPLRPSARKRATTSLWRRSTTYSMLAPPMKPTLWRILPRRSAS